MIARLLVALDRAIDFALGNPPPARWVDDPELDAAVARHPAGKRLMPGDPPPAA